MENISDMSDMSELIDLYKCDPEKHTTCKKTGCHINGGSCYLTTHKEYAKEDE